jgi:DNA-binding response OmpR family regulator
MSGRTPNAAPSRVLLVEDNTLIALDTEESLYDLGVAWVDVAGSSDHALALIEAEPPECALLDFNLGAETSEPVAHALSERGIPFAFATGYSELAAIAGPVRQAVAIIHKPYTRDELAAALRACGRRLRRYLGRAIRQRPPGSKVTSPIPAA